MRFRAFGQERKRQQSEAVLLRDKNKTENMKNVPFLSLGFVITGLVFMMAPSDYFPAYYHQELIGIVSLLTPILLGLPRWTLPIETESQKRLVAKMERNILVILLLGGAGELGLFQLYRYGLEYDKLLHFVIPWIMTASFSIIAQTWWHFPRRKALLFSAILVFGSGIVWECLEAVSDILFGTAVWGVYGNHIPEDTLKDILYNGLGIAFGSFLPNLFEQNKATTGGR